MTAPALRRFAGSRPPSIDVVFGEFSLAAFLLFLPYILSAHGHLDFARHAVGRDFVNVWTAGRLVWTSHRLDVFVPDLFHAWQHRLFDPRLPFHFWSYPPVDLFLAAPFGLLPYFPALALWTGLGLLALAAAARAVVPGRIRDQVLLVLAPASAVNIGLGQNGAFSGAALLTGLRWFDDRPFAAGAVLGLLVLKPQLALLLPVAVIASGRWRAAAGALASGGVLLLLSLAVFGPESWRLFLGPTLRTQSLMLSQGRGPFQWMMPSVFMAGRVLGLPAGEALVAQVPATLLGAALVFSAFRSKADLEARAAVLVTATFLATPQAFNYDLVACSAAALTLARRGVGLFDYLAATLLWTLPLLLLAAQAVSEVAPIPFGPPILLAAAVSAYRLTRPGRARAPSSAAMAGEAVSNT